MSSLVETTGRFSSEKTVNQKSIRAARQSSEEPYRGAEHFAYGIISDVNYDNFQVKVQLFGQYSGTDAGGGAWLPLLNQQDDIQLRWGRLRKGLYCRIHFRGKKEMKHGFVEVIGSEMTDFLQQTEVDNELITNPAKFLGGGMSSF